jgi:hypothetical protein
MGPSGRRLQERRLETDAKTLKAFVQSIPRRRYLCFEEGNLSEWLYELFEPLVDQIAVVQPCKHTGSKNDSIDAWSLANDLRCGTKSSKVFKSPGRFRELREAVRAYQAIHGDLVRIKNRLKAVCGSRGMTGMGDQLYDPRARQEWLAKLPREYETRAQLLSEQLDQVVVMEDKAKKWLIGEAQLHREVRRIATAPGIAWIRSAYIVTTVVSPYRFRTRKQFWSYCGLGIVTRSSSDWAKDRHGQWVRKSCHLTRGLNRNRHPLMKEVFVGAAQTVITQLHDHPLYERYQRTLVSTKPNLARLTLARRIAAAVLAMWKTEENYHPDAHKPHIAA